MAFTKALVYSGTVLALLALAAADVRSLYTKSDGNFAHNGPAFHHPHQADGVHHAQNEVQLSQGSSSPQDSAPLSAGLGVAGLQQLGSASSAGEFRHFEQHNVGSTPTFESEPTLGGSASVFGQGLQQDQAGFLSTQDGLEESSSQSFGRAGPLGPSSQLIESRGNQFEQQQSSGDQFLGQRQAVQSFPPIFHEDLFQSSSQTTGQQQNLDFSSQLSGQDGLGRQQFGQVQSLGSSPLVSSVQQQDGGLMFSSGGQDTVIEETFPSAGLGPDGSIVDNGFRSVDGQLLSAGADAGAQFITGTQQFGSPAVITITTEVTIDRFTTLTNLAYNSVPVTLTEFLKVTRTAPTFETVTTPVDDLVLVSRVPVSRTDTITVTNTNSGYQYATEVSTVLYTITHKHYDIRQQTITSLVVQTQLVRPRVVSTRIDTEYETQTQVQTVTNTVFFDPEVPRTGPLPVPVGLYQTPHFRRHQR